MRMQMWIYLADTYDGFTVPFSLRPPPFSSQIEQGYRGDMLDGMLLRFMILEEARSMWPAGVQATSQDYAKWQSHQEL